MKSTEIENNLDKTFLIIKSGAERKMVIEGRAERADREDLWQGHNESGELLVVEEQEIIKVVGTDDPVSADATADYEVVAGVGTGDHNAGDDVADAEIVAATDGDDTLVADSVEEKSAGTGDPVSADATVDATPNTEHGAAEVPDENWSLERLASFIKVSLRRTAVQAWLIGKALTLAREKHRANRDWLRWLESETGISKSSAYRMIKLAEWFELNEIERQPEIGVCELLDAAKEDGDDDEEDADEEDHVDNESGESDESDDEEDVGESDEDQDEHGNDEGDGKKDGEKVSKPSSIAKKNGKKKTSPPPSGAVSDEEHPPITDTESEAFADFVAAVGGAKRAKYVFAKEIEHYEDLTNGD